MEEAPNPDQLATLQDLCNRYDDNDLVAIQELTLFLENQDNTNVLLFAAISPDISHRLRCFAAIALYKIAVHFSIFWDVPQALNFCTTIYSFLLETDCVHDTIIIELCGALGMAILNNFQRSPEFQELNTQVSSLIHKANPALWDIYLRTGIGMVIQFPFPSNDLCQCFILNFIDEFYQNSVSVLDRIGSSTNPDHLYIIHSALELSHRCLALSTDEETSASHTFASQLLQRKVNDPTLIDFYFHIFDSLFSLQLEVASETYEEPITALECVQTLTSASLATFQVNHAMVYAKVGEHLGHVINGLLKIISGSMPPIIRTRVCMIIHVLGMKVSTPIIREIPTFRQFITVVGDLTRHIINDEEHFRDNQTALSELIDFWSLLHLALQSAGNIEIKPVALSIETDIFLAYLSILLVNVGTNDPEIMIDILEDGNKTTALRTLYLANPPVLGLEVLNHFNDTTNPTQLALLIQLLVSLLQAKPLTTRDTTTTVYHVAFLTKLIELAQAQIPDEIVEMRILEFFSQFKTTVFGNPRSPLYAELRIMSSYTDILAYTLQRVRNSLNHFMHDSDVVQKATSVFVKTLNAASSVQSLQPMIEALIEDHSFEMFPFAALSSNRHSWKLVMFTLADIVIQSESRQLLQKFLAHYETFEPIAMCATDFAGIFEALKTPTAYAVFFDWFFPERATILVKTVAEGCDSGVTGAILRCWERMVSNDNHRIVFSPFSANGVTIFKASADLVLTNLLRQETPAGQLKYVFRILEHLFSGGYVLFEAFEIYNDHVLTDVLGTLVRFLRETKLDTLFSLPRLAADLVQLLTAICSRVLPELLKVDPAILTLVLNIVLMGLESCAYELVRVCADLAALIGMYAESHEIDPACVGQLQLATDRLIEKLLMSSDVSPQRVGQAILCGLRADPKIIDSYRQRLGIAGLSLDIFMDQIEGVLAQGDKKEMIRRLAELQRNVQACGVQYLLGRN